MRYFLIIILLLQITGCISRPFPVSGTVSTATYISPPTPARFIVLPQDPMSLTDQNISNLIGTKLLELGYTKAASNENANIAVLFQYNVGSGATQISTSPNYSTGGQNIRSNTSYPGQFRVTIIDIEKSKKTNSPVIIWLGEINSSGYSSNMSIMAPAFIDILMENSKEDTINKSFLKILM